jgi:hypothetical protein
LTIIINNCIVFFEGVVVSKDEAEIIAEEVAKHFKCFGGGQSPKPFDATLETLKDGPLQFASGVDVESVVRFILRESRKTRARSLTHLTRRPRR